jgi:N-acetylglucosaminyl-diphospho-decaprenol L-rhamnosyltransferase
VSGVGVVMVTLDRREDALRSLERVPGGLPVCVVDNASQDGTAEAVRAAFPDADVVALDENIGGAGRTIGAERLGTPLVAFADDDSWWAPGALDRASGLFDAYPRLGLVAGRVLVGEDERLDPVCEAMRASPLTAFGGRPLPGPAVLGFVACGAIVRTSAFLEVGGFDARYGVGGEEVRLALDLAAAGWDLAYADELVAHHHPVGGGRPGRSVRQIRNDLWSAWLRRPLLPAAARTAGLLREAAPADAAQGALQAVLGLPWVVRERRVVPPEVEAGLALLDRAA